MNETPSEPVPEAEIPPTPSVPSGETRAETQTAESAYVPMPPPSRLTRFKRFMHSATRWASVALFGFLVGVAIMGYLVLRAQAALNNVEKERDQAQFTVAMQSKLLTGMQNDQARLIVLRALSETRAAELALDSNDDVNLPLFVDKAAQLMNAVPDTLMTTQQATVVKIQQKLAMAQKDARGNLQVTKTDLNQVLTDLIENLRNLDALLNPSP
jgi:cell division septal protein FtsQ